jgi:hypothetical protein
VVAELPRAAFLPDRTVRLAAAMLPAAARHRYEREFLSELFGRSSWQQTRYAFDILVHTFSLRTAVRHKASTEEITMTEQPHRPLTCRLNLRHRWVARTTTDGGHYQQCRRCGKDRTEVDHNDRNNPDRSANAAAIGFSGFGSGGGAGF